MVLRNPANWRNQRNALEGLKSNPHLKWGLLTLITTSLASVAVACGIDGMLAKLEKGTANPSLGVLGKITSGLRIEFQSINIG